MGVGSSYWGYRGSRVPKEGARDEAAERTLGPDPGSCVPRPATPAPPRPLPGGGSRASGPKPQDSAARALTRRRPPARTYFAGPSDRRAVDAKAAHAEGGLMGRQTDRRR